MASLRYFLRMPRLVSAAVDRPAFFLVLNGGPSSRCIPGICPRRSLGYSSVLARANLPPGQNVTYEQVKPLAYQPTDDVLIVDVREPDEVIQGNIPSSVNLPLSTFSQALDMHPDDFRKIHGFGKPSTQQAMIFYCRSGKRSATAVDLATKKGFKNTRNYEGSWLDWSAKDSA